MPTGADWSQSPYGAKWFATDDGGATTALSYRGSQSPYGAKWFATLRLSALLAVGTGEGRNPLTGLSGLQQEVSLVRIRQNGGRNPLTGLSGLQLYPPKNVVLDGTAGGGVCEKDEAWNMHRPKGGHFAGFMPMGRLRKKGQGRMHKRI